MSHFRGALHLDFGDWTDNSQYRYTGRFAQLLSPLEWVNTDDGFSCIIPPGGKSLTDGASIPQYLWWFMPPWGDRATVAAILHDYLCRMIDEKTPVPGCGVRAQADAQLYAALVATGVGVWRANLIWIGVRTHSIAYEHLGWFH